MALPVADASGAERSAAPRRDSQLPLADQVQPHQQKGGLQLQIDIGQLGLVECVVAGFYP